MKKVIRMISLILLGIGGIVGMSEAQTTCSAPPSCSALGFDKGAGDCSGQAILRCPFDQSKVFCAGVVPGSGGGETPDASLSGACTGKCAKFVDCNGAAHIYKLSETILRGKYKDQEQTCRDLKEDGRLWRPLGIIRCRNNTSGSYNDQNGYEIFMNWIKEPTWIAGMSGDYNISPGTTCTRYGGCYYYYGQIKDYKNVEFKFCYSGYNQMQPACPMESDEISNIRCVTEYMQ